MAQASGHVMALPNQAIRTHHVSRPNASPLEGDGTMNQRFNYAEAAPGGQQAFRGVSAYLKTCSLPEELIDLVFLRVSQINGCAFCIDKHTRDLLKLGVAQEKVTLVPVWREAGALFSAREQAAFVWAESLTNVAQTGIPDADFAAASAPFSETELSDLTYAIALMNALNRMAISARLPPLAVARLRANA
jgi:AhpD family alkylhydroperoxidase